jgi:hypothetical protein
MVGYRRFPIRLVFSGLFISILFMGVASADIEPNDQKSEAENINEGEHFGSVNLTDNYDWFWVHIDYYKEAKVEAELIDPSPENMVMVRSYGADNPYEYPDGQVFIEVNEGNIKEYDLWRNGGNATALYLRVEGNGNYRIKIIIGEQDPAPSICWLSWFSIGPFGLITIAGTIILIRRSIKN